MMTVPPEQNYLPLTDYFGWVLPGDKRIVLIDGSEVEITAPTTPADLVETFAKLIKPEQYRYPSLGIEHLTVATPALLLVLGKPRLAEEVTKAMIREEESNFPNTPSAFTGHFLRTDLIGVQERLAYRAYSQGRYLLARDCTKRLVRALEQKRPPERVAFFLDVPTLQSVKELLTEIERRIDYPSEPIQWSRLAKLPRAARIQALVGALDSVIGEQPHKLSQIISNDLIIRALVREGDAAVPILIQTFGTDKRLSRAVFPVSGLGNWGAGSHVLSVKEVAWYVLLASWPAAECLERFDIKNRSGPSLPTADVLKAKWNSVGRLSNAARWMLVLNDNQSTDDHWAKASDALISPSGAISVPYIYFRWDNRPSQMLAKGLPAAERAKLTQLMARRAAEIMEKPRSQGPISRSPIHNSISICQNLYKWDQGHCIPCLRKVCNLVLQTEFNDHGDLDETEMDAFVKLITYRSRAGDLSAAADYRKLFTFLDNKKKLGSFSLFKPLWQCPSDPEIRRVGEKRMARWEDGLCSKNPDVARETLTQLGYGFGKIALLNQPAFRRAVVAGLRNSVQIGTFKITTDRGTKWCMYTGLGGGSTGRSLTESEFPEWKPGMGGKVPMSEALAIVMTESGQQGVNEFHLLWNEEKKAEARANLIAWLSDNKLDWAKIIKTNVWADEIAAE